MAKVSDRKIECNPHRQSLEDYPLARYSGALRWRLPRNEREGVLSLAEHVERDSPRLKLAQRETEFQKERRLFHKRRAERVNGQAPSTTRRGEAQNGRTNGRGTVVQEEARA